MPQLPPSIAPRSGSRRWRRAALGAAAILAAGVPIAVGASAAEATTPSSPPPVTVLTSNGNIGPGDIFVSPFGDASTYANGPEILNSNGNVVWFKAVPAGEEASDFRTQTYLGQPVLTWWQGTGLGGLSNGTDYIYNDRYQQIATVNAGNGLSADGHEFLITPWNTALILSYTTATANLTSIGGPADQTVIDGVVQEIDIATGKVLFQWNSADHVPYSQSEQPLPASPSEPWDWFHVNAVKLDSDGNLLIDARDTWTTYKVSLATGNIIWQLGGKDLSFTLQAAPGRSSTAPTSCSPGSTTPSQWATTSTRSSTTSPPAPRCSPTAARSRSSSTPGRKSPRSWPPTTSPRGSRRPRKATRRPPLTATSSSAGASCRTSRSSIRKGTSSSTPSSRRA